MNPRPGCPSESEWMRFCLGDNTERDALESHLQHCEQCRMVVGDLERELASTATVWRKSARPSIYYLFIASDPAELAAERQVLAAKGDDVPKLAQSVVLASPGQEIIIRAVRDPRTDDTWLYLIADDSSLIKNVLVRPFGGDERLTDDKGRVNLGPIKWPEQERLTAEVHLPMAVFTLLPLDAPPTADNRIELGSLGGDRIRVTFTADGRNRRLQIEIIALKNSYKDLPLRIAVRGAGEREVLHINPVVSERASFDDVDLSGKVEIYLYQ